MREETEGSRSSGQDECDDVEDETVGQPFGDYVGDLDFGVVPEQGVDVCERDRVSRVTAEGRSDQDLASLGSVAMGCAHQFRSPTKLLNK